MKKKKKKKKNVGIGKKSEGGYERALISIPSIRARPAAFGNSISKAKQSKAKQQEEEGFNGSFLWVIFRICHTLLLLL